MHAQPSWGRAGSGPGRAAGQRGLLSWYVESLGPAAAAHTGRIAAEPSDSLSVVAAAGTVLPGAETALVGADTALLGADTPALLGADTALPGADGTRAVMVPERSSGEQAGRAADGEAAGSPAELALTGH